MSIGWVITSSYVSVAVLMREGEDDRGDGDGDGEDPVLTAATWRTCCRGLRGTSLNGLRLACGAAQRHGVVCGAGCDLEVGGGDRVMVSSSSAGAGAAPGDDPTVEGARLGLRAGLLVVSIPGCGSAGCVSSGG